MDTRGTIAVVHEDGTVSQIYSHWDNYLEHNGDILRKHYTTRGSVEELVKLGHLSSLGTWIHPDGKHSHKDPEEEVCVFYGRDRGEANQEPNRFQNYTDYKQNAGWEEYNYLFKDGLWYVKCDYKFPVFTELNEAFEVELAQEDE